MNEDFYINLIYKKLDNLISDVEETQLRDWIKTNSQNQLTYDGVLLAWNTTERDADPQFDLNDAYSKLEARINFSSEGMKGQNAKNKNAPWLMYSSIAATILLMLAIASQFLFPSNDTNWVEIVADVNLQEVRLPDNSTVVLRKNSVFKYSDDYNNSRISSLKGEGFFMVTSNPNNAFEVTTDHGLIRVLGTSFNIKSTDDHTTVNVKTGKVSVTNLNNDKVFLVKGEGILVSKNKKEIGQPRTLIYDEIDWTDRYLNFDDKSLTHVIGKISSVYPVKIKVTDEIKNCPVTVIFDNQPLDIIVESLGTMLSAEVTKHNSNFYEIKNGGCEK